MVTKSICLPYISNQTRVSPCTGIYACTQTYGFCPEKRKETGKKPLSLQTLFFHLWHACVSLHIRFQGEVEKEAVANWLKHNFLLILSNSCGFWLTVTDHDVSSLSHLKLIPSKRGILPGFEPLISRTPNPWSPVALHACDAAWPAFPYPNRPTVDNVVGLKNNFLHVIQWVLVRSSSVVYLRWKSPLPWYVLYYK